MPTSSQKEATTRAIALGGGPSAVAREFQIRRPWAVSKWVKAGKVPADRVPDLVRLIDYKVTPHELLPEVYQYPDDGLPPEVRERMFGQKAA